MALVAGLVLFLLLSLGANYLLLRALVLTVPRPSSPPLPVGATDHELIGMGFSGIGEYPASGSGNTAPTTITVYVGPEAVFALADGRTVTFWTVWDDGSYAKTACGRVPLAFLIRSRTIRRVAYRVAADVRVGLELHRRTVASFGRERGAARPADDYASVSIGLALARGTASPIITGTVLIAAPISLLGFAALIVGIAHL